MHRRARRSTQPLGVMIHPRALAFVCLLLVAGCNTTPVMFSANESCNLPPNVWHQTPVPPERELLLGLPEKTMGNPVRESFVATSAQQEAWFQDSKGNLQACIYNPLNRRSCSGGELALVVFTKTETTWEAGPTMKVMCYH